MKYVAVFFNENFYLSLIDDTHLRSASHSSLLQGFFFMVASEKAIFT